MKIRLANKLLQVDSIVDGEGLRCVLWTQGCPHHCEGCHNKQTHSFDQGYLVDVEEIKKQIAHLPFQDGLTLSGGEPFMQPLACLEIVKEAKKYNKNIWCYSGFTYEQILNDSNMKKLLVELDVLVDGKFELANKSLNLHFKGSTNQRIIDVQKSLKTNSVVVIEKYNQFKNYQLSYQKKDFMFI